MKIGVLYDDVFLDHHPGTGHPERGERLEALRPLVRGASRLSGIEVIAADRLVTAEELGRVHAPGHLETLAALRGRSVMLDPDTCTSEGSWGAAMRSAAAGLVLFDAIRDGAFDAGFALVRPPGHHAEATRAMGFCLVNNVAVAVAHARAVHGLERVMVLDWDVHHGNGTQHTFEEDPGVLFLSAHRYPFYPGTGAADEVGRGAGTWTTINVPLPGGAGDAEYDQVFADIVRPVIETYRPEAIFVSAGFDAHRRDPLGGMRVSAACFGRMAALVASLCDGLGRIPLVLLLEGGYDLEGLEESVRQVLVALRDEQATATVGDSRVAALVDHVRTVHRGFEPLASV